MFVFMYVHNTKLFIVYLSKLSLPMGLESVLFSSLVIVAGGLITPSSHNYWAYLVEWR